jgi:homoserine dehydrogenase
MKALKVGLVGMGTVGSGTYQVLQRNKSQIESRLGRDIQIVMVADLDVDRVRTLVDKDCRVVADAADIIANPDIDILIELIGGYGIAKDIVLNAIAAGKHVVTANKALLAVHGVEIFHAAKSKGVMIGYEASVAGGIPIIKVLREGLTANKINWVAGIINGTTNFILTQMREKAWGFEQALKEAQNLGYAEADPTFDIQGIDAAHKCSIMASLAFGIPIPFGSAYIEGITELQAQDIQFAEQLGYRIKLLGITKSSSQGIEVRVHPCLISEKSLLANVEGAMNAVMVNADAAGTSMYYGKGAGGEPTASAVIADLVDIARWMHVDPDHRVPALAFHASDKVVPPVLSMDQVTSCYYMRIGVADQPGVLAGISSLLAQAGISVDAMIQHPADVNRSQTQILILTHQANEAVVNAAIEKIEQLPTVLAPVVRIRKEDFN